MSKPLAVKCNYCAHVWAVCFLPQDVKTIVQATQGARCPICDTGVKNITMADEDDIAAATMEGEHDSEA